MGPACPGADVALGDHRPKRQSACDAFGDAENVWLHVPMLAGEHLSGSAKASLDFIGYQEDAVTLADISKQAEKL